MHIIRLRGPWLLSSLHAPEVEAVRGRIEQPCRNFLDLPGPVIYVRHFNRPTGLGEHDCVQLAIVEFCGSIAIKLNQHPITPQPLNQPPVRVDITEHLQASNRLEIELFPSENEREQAGITGIVQLEIDE